jgi:hypothetical protein
MNDGWYSIGATLVGVLTFLGVWVYAIATWGFLLGVGFGWIPAIIAAIVAGLLWPLLAVIAGIAVIAVFLIVSNNIH